MKQRPAAFSILAVAFVALALSFPVQALWLYEQSLRDWPVAFARITTLNLLVIAALLANIYPLLMASRWLFVTMPITAMLVGWNNFVVGRLATDYSLGETSIATVGFVGLCLILTHRPARWVLLNPKGRWWLAEERARVRVAVQIDPYVQMPMKGRTFDLSATGVFIPLDSCLDKKSSSPVTAGVFKVGDFTSLRIKLSETQSVRCEAEVVRIAADGETYPAGFGLRFRQLGRRERAQIREFVKSQPEQLRFF